MGIYLGQSVYNESQVTPAWVEEEISKNGKGVFFATHGQTTYQNISQEYNNGKIIVVKYEPVTPGETTTYYFNLVRFNTETFDFVGVMQDGTIYRTGINVNEGWENVTTFKLDEIQFVEYNVDSYSTIKIYYDYGKFIVLKYRQQTPLVTKYYFYPLISVDETNKEIVFGSLQLGQNNKKITFTVTDSTGWAAPAESPAVVVDVALDSSSHNPVENMAIAAELTAINNMITGDLNDIFLALASKGVTVPAGAGLDDVAGLIDDIETGGGPTPLPDNWITVLGIKKVSNYRDTHFTISLGEYTSNENIIFEFDMKFVDFSSTSQQITIATYPPDLVFVNNTGVDAIDFLCGNDDGSFDNTRIPNSSASKPDLNNRFKIEYNRNVGKIYASNGTFNLNLYYSKKNFISFELLVNDSQFSSYIFYGLTIKKRDTGDYLLKLIPVKNQTNGYCGFYDIVSGRLFQANHNPESYQAVE